MTAMKSTGVPDARAAAKIIFDSGADLVISEVNLPETDGLRFCRALRENTTSAPIPFFFLTVEQGDTAGHSVSGSGRR